MRGRVFSEVIMSMFRSMYQCREIERAFALVVALVAVDVARSRCWRAS